jgi:hypothetical protein
MHLITPCGFSPFSVSLPFLLAGVAWDGLILAYRFGIVNTFFQSFFQNIFSAGETPWAI